MEGVATKRCRPCAALPGRGPRRGLLTPGQPPPRPAPSRRRRALGPATPPQPANRESSTALPRAPRGGGVAGRGGSTPAESDKIIRRRFIRRASSAPRSARWGAPLWFMRKGDICCSAAAVAPWWRRAASKGPCRPRRGAGRDGQPPHSAPRYRCSRTFCLRVAGRGGVGRFTVGDRDVLSGNRIVLQGPWRPLAAPPKKR